MNKMIRTYTAITAVTLLLSACTPYPTSGTIDTRSVRERAEILEISGDVYGIKTGGVKAAQDLTHDRDLLANIATDIWKSTYTKEPLGEITPRYIEQSAFQGSVTLIKKAASEMLSKKEKELQVNITEIEQAIDEQMLVEQETNIRIANYKKVAGNTDEVIAKLTEEKNTLIQLRNDLIRSALNNVNVIANEHGLAEMTKNPLNRYSSTKINPTHQLTCSEKNKYLVVDLIKEQSECLYFRFPNELMSYQEQIAKDLKQAVIAISEVEQKLGKEGGWMTKATGIFATIKVTKKAGEEAKRAAEKQFGRLYRLETKLERVNAERERLAKRFTHMKTPEYYLNEMKGVYFSPRIEHRFSFDDARSEIFNKFFVKNGKITASEKKNGLIENIDSGLEMVMAYTELLTSYRGRREALVSVDFIDLTDEKVKAADKLNIEVMRKSLKSKPSREVSKEKFLQRIIKLTAKQKNTET